MCRTYTQTIHASGTGTAQPQSNNSPSILVDASGLPVAKFRFGRLYGSAVPRDHGEVDVRVADPQTRRPHQH